MATPPEERLAGPRRPPRIFDLTDPPEAVFLRGVLPRGPAVAIVGTRTCSAPARAFAEELSGELTRAGVLVLSGGARGIDTAAHEGALSAGGVTVVVAPSGFSRPFPLENAELFSRILESGGGYVSLVPTDTPANRGCFFARNALLVALAHAVIVVEAGYRSGARNAAAQARRLNRPVFVVPHAPWNSRGAGCIEELKHGGLPIRDARDVLRGLRAARLHPLPLESRGPPTLASADVPSSCGDVPAAAPGSDRTRVLEALRRGCVSLDGLCSASGLAVSEVQRILFTLRLEGVVTGDGRGGMCLPTH